MDSHAHTACSKRYVYAADHAGASRILLRDWSTSKFPRYTMPASSAAAPSPDPALAEIYAKDEQILAKLPTRKEMRKAGGVVKMTPAEVESRRVLLDASWIGSDDEDGNDGDEEDEEDEMEEDISGDMHEDGTEDEDSDAEDEDEDDEDEEMGDEDELDAPPAKGKRKRATSKVSAPVRPAKKVAFAAEPSGSKQARSPGGKKGSQAASKASTNAAAASRSAKQKDQRAKAPSTDKSRKPASGTKKPSLASSAGQKVANAASKKTAPHAGEEAYDFKKFF